ncbi:MAG: carboxypeptidase regulatory-like domain-containing protein [Bacteroidetes bacterium]|nr:carboxypeptidase regulatory-like domain-containing protein [Bacteroidota bacterium]
MQLQRISYRHQGTITNIENGKAIRNAIVEMIDYPLVGENSIRSTNSAGNYHFKKVSLTKATIRVRANDFTTAEFEVNVTKNRITDFDIQLTPALELVPETA